MNEQVKSFLERTHFPIYNDYRVDLEILAVANKGELLIWDDNKFDGTVVDIHNVDANTFTTSNCNAVTYMLQCLKDGGQVSDNHVTVVGLRKERGSDGTINSTRRRLWCADYGVDEVENKIYSYEQILNTSNERLIAPTTGFLEDTIKDSNINNN